MKYSRDKKGNTVSRLAFGCMRLSGDYAKNERAVMTAIELGVNYFDTAYIYPGNESMLGEILARNGIRDKVSIATKLPHYLIKSVEDAEKMFNEELRRLKTDYVDYYLMHMLTDVETWQRLCDLGIDKWLREKVENGKIRQIGFSYHGNTEEFIRLVDERNWDFCMIQYNYLDEHSQAGRRGFEYAADKGLPVFIMEPLRGGRLANKLPESARRIFESYPVKRSPVDWALRWLWNQPQVTSVLSGMTDEKMVRENANIVSTTEIGGLTDAELAIYSEVTSAVNAKLKVGCTGCGYCMPCPRNVDIPGTFAAYNRKYSDGIFTALKEYAMCTALRKNSSAASNCIGCGKCEKHCPQGIEIRNELKKAVSELEGIPYKLVKMTARLFRF